MRFNDALPDPFEDFDPDLEALLDEEFALGDGTADTTADVRCPYCGEANEVAVDPGSGAAQEYVEDCQVCCRPWRVVVSYDGAGAAHVYVEATDD
ncbi:MAG: CPXCG motif-containing cysteine-rich protein [Gemmatimonadaceae bacterium]